MVAKECDAIACQRSSPRTAANCDERCRSQPKGISPRIPQRGLRKCCWLRQWIAFRLRLSGLLQLLDTLRNKLRRTLWHLRQQLRHSLRASKIRLSRTVRTVFLLRVPTERKSPAEAGLVSPSIGVFGQTLGESGGPFGAVHAALVRTFSHRPPSRCDGHHIFAHSSKPYSRRQLGECGRGDTCHVTKDSSGNDF